MKTLSLVAAALLLAMLSGCAVVPYGPGVVVTGHHHGHHHGHHSHHRYRHHR